MKAKYTLSIADMEINVITEAPQESVEYIVGILDRKIREISLKSKKCTKSEAAVLCALDFCADKIELKDRVEVLEDELSESKDNIEHLNEKLELIQKNSERLERDRARLEVENSRLRAILDDIRAGKKYTREELSAVDKAEPEIAAPVGDVYAATESAQTEEAVSEGDTENQKKKTAGRNRVGSMFDLLTFTDI
ncbi:MAG: cell division protein ZapA [Clostridia bacterium]|nr:cell division protein ZapA [Clostridia bacterium]MBQ9750966.1 cell division protein ZapA [Clostridia bacterium]